MNITVITDIHDRLDYPKEAIDRLHAADLVLIAGDFTNFGDRDEAMKVIKKIAAYNPRILAVSGNCDRPGVAQILSEQDMDLHGTCRTVDRVMFLGLGGSNKTPLHTPQEYTDEEMTELLGRFGRKPDVDKYVLVTHAPPFKTKLDRMFIGLHVGSKAIRRFIESFQPDFAVCGHIHEARGTDNIGKTLIINPGPFPKHYAMLDLRDQTKYELF